MSNYEVQPGRIIAKNGKGLYVLQRYTDWDTGYGPMSGADADAFVKELVRRYNAHEALVQALDAMLDVQGRRRHPLGQPDEGIATAAVEAASKARTALRLAKGE